MSSAQDRIEGSASQADGPAVAGALASLALCMLLPSLGTSIANVALPTLAPAFTASFQQVQWVVLAYLLATTTLVVTVGRLGDVAGRRRLLLTGILVFTAASALCGAATGLAMLIAARAAQGVGAAIMLALTLAFVSEAIPKPRIGRAVGMLGTMSAVGTALGPTLGGVLIAAAGWRSIFLVNLPLGLLALVLAWRYLPADRQSTPGLRTHFDIPGTLLLALALAAYALAMTLGHGDFGLINLLLLVAAAAGMAMFLAVEKRSTAPLINLSRLRDPVLATALLVSALVATVIMATLIVGPFHLSGALELATAHVGLAMSAGPLVAALASVAAGRAVDHFGAARMTVSGLAGMACGAGALAMVPTAWGVAGYLLPSVLLTGSYALLQTANNTAVMQQVAADQRGVVSGLLNLSRNLGLITGTAVLGAVFSIASRTDEAALAPPRSIAHGMHITFAVAAGLVGVALAIAVRSRRLSAPTPLASSLKGEQP